MRRWIAASAAALLLAGLVTTSSVTVLAADKTVTGTIAALTTDSITIKGKEAETTLVVDGKTRVVGTGIGTKSEKMKEEKKTTHITDLLKTGDAVSATYDETTKHASEVRLTKAAAK